MINEFKIMNPQALISIYGNILNFDGSEILDVQLKRDGATLVLRLMTNQAIKTKSKRWDKWDVIYIEMPFFAIRELKISGWGTDNKIDKFDILEKDSEGILEVLCNNQNAIKCQFDWSRVEQITPGLIGSP